MKNPTVTSFSQSEAFTTLCTNLNVQTTAAKEALIVALENILLLDKKQLDYGSKNISEFGVFGCVVRMSDKHARLANLFVQRRNRPVNESIEDTFRDISNYSIIALLVANGKWPKE